MPHVSSNFEDKIKELIRLGLLVLNPEKEYTMLFERWTRKGFCNNIGCRQKEWGNCTFVAKYKVYLSHKTKAFKYKIYVKGRHDQLLYGKCLNPTRNILVKTTMNALLQDGKSNSKFHTPYTKFNVFFIEDIIDKTSSLAELVENKYTEDNYNLLRKTISNRRLIVKNNQFIDYKNTFAEIQGL